jgi:hypothetical protein
MMVATTMMKTKFDMSFVIIEHHQQKQSFVDLEWLLLIELDVKFGMKIMDTLLDLMNIRTVLLVVEGSTRDTSNTQYPGLSGGRLYGYNDKLPIIMKIHLATSFKALFGAYDVSSGLEQTWINIFCQYFDELLL